MSDIVERLRNEVCLLSRLDWQEHVALANEAADEIERLRRAAGEWLPISEAKKGEEYLLFHPREHGRNSRAPWVTMSFYPPTHPRKPTHFFRVPAPPEPDHETE
jgi:hypothetical protein